VSDCRKAVSLRAGTHTGVGISSDIELFDSEIEIVIACCGITGKLMAPSFRWYVLFFYILNFLMVGADLVLYVRNYRMDQQRKQV